MGAGGRCSQPRSLRPRQARPWRGGGPGPGRAGGAHGKAAGPGLHGWAGSAAAFSAQCPQPRSHSSGLPCSPLLSSFISQRWQAWKGFWWEMCFELAYFPLHTMEALSCCVLQVQTKAAQAVFSSTVWSFIPPLLHQLQAYLTNFHSFCKEGSTTDKILLFDRFQTFKRQSFYNSKSSTVSVHCLHWTAAQGPPQRAGLAALNIDTDPVIEDFRTQTHSCEYSVLYSKLNYTPVCWTHFLKYLFWKWETEALCCKEEQKKAFCPSWNYPLV